jgi:hypothetical protein
MATPTFFAPPPSVEEITRSLEKAVRRQQEATPEPVFRRQEVTQSYDYLCEIEHKRFPPEEVDMLRSRIAEAYYWECEARKYNDLLSELTLENLCRKYCVDGVQPTDGWRQIAMAYRRRLKRQGCSTQQARESRLSIKDQRYWKPEAECLRDIAAFRESEMLEEYRARKAKVQGMSCPAESKTQFQEEGECRLQEHAKEPTRRSRRLQTNSRQPRVDGVQDERGAGFRSSGASKVAKRRRKVGAKKRRY